MGVSGWTRLLAEEGWLPDSRKTLCCSPSLWMDMNQITNSGTVAVVGDQAATSVASTCPSLNDRMVVIPPQSELHIDGFCLCFHVYEVAYARHINSVVYSKSNHQQRPCVRPKVLASLSAQQVRHLLPSFLPLKLLADVTTEFVKALRDKHRMKLVVYWDGDQRYSVKSSSTLSTDGTVPSSPNNSASGSDEFILNAPDEATPQRAFKHDTDEKRQVRLETEWADFYQYCQNGRMPGVKHICDWSRSLPKHRLFTSQVMHALQVARVAMVYCDEEADRVLAQAVTGRPMAYVVGSDSDFCFFPNVNYIPLPTLDASRNDVLVACVLRRDELATSLGLPDEHAMVELAILMGNDYVNPKTADLDCPHTTLMMESRDRTTEILSFLSDQGPGYRVTSQSSEVQDALRFVRLLYNLHDLSEFDSQDKRNSSMDSHPMSPMRAAAAVAVIARPEVGSPLTPLVRPTIASEELNACLNVVQPAGVDTSVKDAIVQCLQAYAHQANAADGNGGGGDGSNQDGIALLPEHFAAFEQLHVAGQRQTYKDLDKGIPDKAWRPAWEDVLVVYLIEKIVNRYVWNFRDSLALRLHPPYALFDAYKYHALLQLARSKTTLPLPMSPPLSHQNGNVLPLLSTEPEIVERPVLPIDEFESIILDSVRKNRVTVIQGDTGCGKSSRIPVMLLRAPCPESGAVGTSKLFISQPRRIAAKALVERLRSVEPDLRDQIALRMGHGVREYETPTTRAFFVTTGYLVRLLANNPQSFDRVAYLIIDEVHERSVDTDLLCLLCRRLLTTNPRIRFVLMSATLAAALFQEYFGVTEPVIKVGARRFPVEEVYLGDIPNKFSLPAREAKFLEVVKKECLDMKCTRPPSNQYMEKLYTVVSSLATLVGKPGSSVLIFVAGMNDIVAITEQLEQFYVPGVTFTAFPIHSDIPFEDQMEAFVPPAADEVKVIIATNAAESSVTLPNVDHVICLGLCKQILYNEASHRQMLMPTWISRASATQRAGRTGRVRPGTVYRMYHRENFDDHMLAFEPGEMLRTPLDSVILMLKEILPDEDVTDILLSCLEPPNISTIDRSFESLHKSHFITSPDGNCLTTTLGSFVSALGIDLTLGSLIGLGIQFGVGAEAIQMASILSFPKSPWVQSNPLIHEPASYNAFVSTTYSSKCHFDANLFSEPLAAMNLLWDYSELNQTVKQRWCTFYGVFLPRLKRLESTYLNLVGRVAGFLGIEAEHLRVLCPPRLMEHSKIQVLRCLQVWVFDDTVVQLDPSSIKVSKSKKGISVDLLFKSDRIQKEHLEPLLNAQRHPFYLVDPSEIQQKGSFIYKHEQDFASTDLEERLLSYSTEKGYGLVWISFTDKMTVFCRDGLVGPEFVELLPSADSSNIDFSLLHADMPPGKIRRGRQERACGLWTITPTGETRILGSGTTWVRFNFGKSKTTKGRWDKLEREIIDFSKENSIQSMSIQLQCDSHLKSDKHIRFSLVARGSRSGINETDMKDLLASPTIKFSTNTSSGKQKLVFPVIPQEPWAFELGSPVETVPGTSWVRPLVSCIPEGARILSVLAAGRRREFFIRLPGLDSESGDDSEETLLLDIHLDSAINVSSKWKRYNTDLGVYVEANCVPSSAVPLEETEMMYCTCANALEVRGGGIKANGLTLLPAGKLFLYLCRLAFGLVDEEKIDDGSLMHELMSSKKHDERFLQNRIDAAINFDSSSKHLGERLECFPEKVEELVSMFSGIDTYDCVVWKDLASNPLVSHNLRNNRAAYRLKKQTVAPFRETPSSIKPPMEIARRGHQGRRGIASDNRIVLSPDEEKREVVDEDDVDVDRENELILALTSGLAVTSPDRSSNGSSNRDRARIRGRPNVVRESVEEGRVFTLLSDFSVLHQHTLEQLFSRTLPPGEELLESDLPSSNILSIVVYQTRTMIDANTSAEPMRITGSDWSVYTISIDGSSWYYATFSCSDLSLVKRTSKSLPSWLKETNTARVRPTTVDAALRCLPPEALVDKEKMRPVISLDGKRATLVFDTLELAIRMEAAFWLERQFLTTKRHWYQHLDLTNMVNRLKDAYRADSTSRV